MTKLSRFLKLPISKSQDLSAAVLAYTTTIGRKFRVESISFKFSQAITETITITKDSKLGANYDTVLRNKSLIAETSFIYVPERGDEMFNIGDELQIDCTDANGVGIVYVEIKLSEG